MTKVKKIYKDLPETPGVYLMKNSRGQVLYVGKAANLRRRVSSYFLSAGRRTHDSRIEKLIQEIKKIDYKKTDTALEALILEAELIKKKQPPYNIKEKDDKSFLYIDITKDKFPRILLVRGKNKTIGERFGPFTSASSIREALRIVRKIFPFSIHPSNKVGKFKRPCFDYEISLCPGTCISVVERKDYLRVIKSIKLLFQGKKEKLLKDLEKEMNWRSKRLQFETAAKLRGKIFALKHIQDIALISDEQTQRSAKRIEGYDVSNISGQSAVGSMIVFHGDKPNKNGYRKFKIKTIKQADDIGMLKEMLRRRFTHIEWPLPMLILVDGGKGQVNAMKEVLADNGFKIPVVGIAKGAKRKKNEFIGAIPKGIDEKTLINIRDEAHRFAYIYHKKVRGSKFLTR